MKQALAAAACLISLLGPNQAWAQVNIQRPAAAPNAPTTLAVRPAVSAVVVGLPAPIALWVRAPDNDDGRHIDLEWTTPNEPVSGVGNDGVYLVFRSPFETRGAPPVPPSDIAIGDWLGDWQLIAQVAGDNFRDDVTADYLPAEAGGVHVWRLSTADDVEPAVTDVGASSKPGGPAKVATGAFTYAVRTAALSANRKDDRLTAVSPAVMTGPARAKTAYFNTDNWFYLFSIVAMGLALAFFVRRITKNPEGTFIRRIAGVDAIEDAVGRSTEMGRPVLYVTGTEEIQNIQTIASLLVLGRVAEMTAEYDTEMKVANFFPLTMVVAEEIVRTGYANAGRIDAHRPENVMFISAEQFAFAAGVNGLILRDRPATNIYLGRFFAESLILAETGFVTGAVQIAGTAEITQLPFFIAACDYTIIGEELYAVSAYLSREPGLLATLKSNDALKLGAMILITTGLLLASFGVADITKVLFP